MDQIGRTLDSYLAKSSILNSCKYGVSNLATGDDRTTMFETQKIKSMAFAC